MDRGSLYKVLKSGLFDIETARRMFRKYKALSQEYADTAENTGRQPSGERYENLGQPAS